MSAPKVLTIPVIFHWIDKSSTKRILHKIEARTEVKEEHGIYPWEIKRKPGETFITLHFVDGCRYVINRAKISLVTDPLVNTVTDVPMHIIVYDTEDNVCQQNR